MSTEEEVKDKKPRKSRKAKAEPTLKVAEEEAPITLSPDEKQALLELFSQAVKYSGYEDKNTVKNCEFFRGKFGI